nr:glycosyltransferase family 4 protein [Halomonas smyrnensis]
MRQLRILEPKILHTHSSKTGLLGRLAAHIARVPVVIHTVHGFAFPFASNGLVRLIYYWVEFVGARFCDALIVLNESDRKKLIDDLKVSEKKVHLIPNGIRLEEFGRSEETVRSEIRSEVFGASIDTICIGMVGRLWHQKNPKCLFDAAKKIVESTDKSVKFVFIGDGELRGELEKEIVSYGLESHVMVLGWRTDIARLLSALDVFVLPSRWEGMPLAILEAMASALAVVVSDIPGNNDLVAHDQDGLLFPSEDDEQLSVQLFRLINDPSLRKSLASEAQKKVVSKYHLEMRNQSVFKLYDDLLLRKR